MHTEPQGIGRVLPDIEPYRHGNGGAPFVWTRDSGVSGQHAMISALTHGNEPAGMWAVKTLLDTSLRPVRGRLSLAFVNFEAYSRYRKTGDDRYRCVDRDMNRLWRDDWIDADNRSVEAHRAQELRTLLDDVDVLLDLHTTAYVAEPFVVLADQPKHRLLADAMAWPCTQQIMPGGCAEGRHLVDYNRFGIATDPATALTIECGTHAGERSAGNAMLAAVRFLQACRCLDDETADALGTPLPCRTIKRFVTREPCIARTARFELRVSTHGPVAVNQGDVVAMDGRTPVRAPFDAVIVSPRPAPRSGETAFLWCVEVDRREAQR